jgi:hypothetical protein
MKPRCPVLGWNLKRRGKLKALVPVARSILVGVDGFGAGVAVAAAVAGRWLWNFTEFPTPTLTGFPHFHTSKIKI